jgi:hypothetical protein
LVSGNTFRRKIHQLVSESAATMPQALEEVTGQIQRYLGADQRAGGRTDGWRAAGEGLKTRRLQSTAAGTLFAPYLARWWQPGASAMVGFCSFAPTRAMLASVAGPHGGNLLTP